MRTDVLNAEISMYTQGVSPAKAVTTAESNVNQHHLELQQPARGRVSNQLGQRYDRGAERKADRDDRGGPPYEQISPKAYEHPADKAATSALHSVPLLDTVVKRLTDLGHERRLRQIVMGNAIRLGPEPGARRSGAPTCAARGSSTSTRCLTSTSSTTPTSTP